MTIESVADFEGIEIADGNAVALVMTSVRLAVAIHAARAEKKSDAPDARQMALDRLARAPALQTANALLAAARAECTRAAPPADIEMVPDTGGELIYQCLHASPHKWKLDGSKI